MNQTPAAREQLWSLAFALLLVDPDGNVADANPETENMIGISSRRMVGRPISDMVAFEGTDLLERLTSLDSRLVARGITARFRTREMEVNVSIAPVTNHPGWRVLTMSDAGQGDRFSAEDAMSRQRGQAILAHEIKTPLSAIRGAAQLLARKVPEDAKALSRLIADEVDRIVTLIDRMQRLGREKAQPVEPLNLHSAIHRACDTVRASAGGELAIIEEFDPSLPSVLAHEGSLVQVLINLIGNARDATQGIAEPQITLRTRFASGLVLNVIRLGRPVRLPIEVQVIDNGPGIDPALRDEIFEPFVTSKNNGQGLGLALVQKLVRDMNGRIAHSRDDSAGQTIFRINLPMSS